MRRTRIKICGVTRPEDAAAAAEAGVDAVGFNCYPRSPRFVELARLRDLAAALPPFVVPVLLFVNATPAQVEAGLAEVPDALLQFHGDEPPSGCERFGRPYIRALRMSEGVDLLDCARSFPSAAALLVDTPAAGYGGSGTRFDWTRLPAPSQRTKPLILAGGLDPSNVIEAISQVRPFAVDVSSGVEQAPGIKSAERIERFCAAVRAADRNVYPEHSPSA
jgi:phosphoribosylanthranilate isomerase